MNLLVDYDLILDPPILEDVGAFNLNFQNLTFEGYFKTMIEDEGTPE